MRVLVVGLLLGTAVYGATAYAQRDADLHLGPTASEWATVPPALRPAVERCMTDRIDELIARTQVTTFRTGRDGTRWVFRTAFEECREEVASRR